jgi:hypothetical protein
MGAWEDFIDNLKDDEGMLSKDTLKNLVTAAKADSEEFIRRQGEKLELYLSQLATGQITKEQLNSYIIDIKDLTEMHALKMSVEAKVKAEHLIIGICNIIIDGLLRLI